MPREGTGAPFAGRSTRSSGNIGIQLIVWPDGSVGTVRTARSTLPDRRIARGIRSALLALHFPPSARGFRIEAHVTFERGAVWVRPR